MTSSLSLDALICFATRLLRMFNYGAIAPVFFLYMVELGFSEMQTGALITAILFGDLCITLYLTTRADGFGRRRTLLIGAALKVLAGVAFGLSSNYAILVTAGVIGVISTSGGECGPFQSTEQAALTDAVLARKKREAAEAADKLREQGGREEEAAAIEVAGTTSGAAEIAVLFGWYNGTGYITQALGALVSGLFVHFGSSSGALSLLDAYRCVFFGYAAVGALMALLYAGLSPSCEANLKAAPGAVGIKGLLEGPRPCCPVWLAPLLPTMNLGLRRRESRAVVARLSVMFALDAFGGSFVMQTWVAFWFAQRWGFSSELLGYLLMGANVVAGLSGVAAAYFVKQFGPMLTMIASHLPSNVLLLAVPLMPTAPTAAAMLVARFSISQMDVPARQAYVVMVVASDERSAAGGITGIVRSLGMSASPLLLGYLSSAPVNSALFSSPWIIAGVIKIVYDIVLYTLYLCDDSLRSGVANAATSDKREAEAEAEAETESFNAPLLSDTDERSQDAPK